MMDNARNRLAAGLADLFNADNTAEGLSDVFSNPEFAVILLPKPIWQRVENGEGHPDHPLAEFLFQTGETTVEVDDMGCIVVHGPTVPEWVAHGFRDGGSAYRMVSTILAAAQRSQAIVKELGE
jgi:hypothetical protein